MRSLTPEKGIFFLDHDQLLQPRPSCMLLELSMQDCVLSLCSVMAPAPSPTVAVASSGSVCMTYTPHRRKSRPLKGLPLTSTCPLSVPFPAVLHARAFSCAQPEQLHQYRVGTHGENAGCSFFQGFVIRFAGRGLA